MPRLDADHWESIYREGEPGWDLGMPTPPFVSLLADPPAWLTSGRILNPGAGLGHDALLFAEHGFHVTALDFADSAIIELKKKAATQPNLSVLQADLFAVPEAHHGTYDYVLEHTCFCAIHPSQRETWLTAMANALKPNGILFGLFYRFDPPDDNGPPFALSEEELKRLIAPHFEIISMTTPADSLDRRANRERFVVFRKTTEDQ